MLCFLFVAMLAACVVCKFGSAMSGVSIVYGVVSGLCMRLLYFAMCVFVVELMVMASV